YSSALIFEPGRSPSVRRWGGVRLGRGHLTESADDQRFNPHGDGAGLGSLARSCRSLGSPGRAFFRRPLARLDSRGVLATPGQGDHPDRLDERVEAANRPAVVVAHLGHQRIVDADPLDPGLDPAVVLALSAITVDPAADFERRIALLLDMILEHLIDQPVEFG